jgi:hypothetical protein
MPNRRTVSLRNITRPERNHGAGQVQSPSRYSAGYPRVSNGTPGIRCCPVRLSTYREEAVPMRSQPLRGDASRRRAEEHFKTTKKVNSETKANTPSAGQGSRRQGYCKSRRRGSQGPEIRAASTRSKTSGLNPVRTQVRLSGISVDRPDRYAASSAKHGELLWAETNRFAQVSTFNMRAPDRSPAEICSAQVRASVR